MVTGNFRLSVPHKKKEKKRRNGKRMIGIVLEEALGLRSFCFNGVIVGHGR